MSLAVREGMVMEAGEGSASALARAVERERVRRVANRTVDAEEAGAIAVRPGRVSMREVVAQTVAELQVRRTHRLDGLRTGIEAFDAVAHELLQPGRIIGVAASTKVGKTALLNQWAASFAAQGVPVLVFSFEDEVTDTVARYLANIGTQDVGAIRSGYVADGELLPVPAAFDDAVSTVADLDIDWVTQPSTCSQIAQEVLAWRRSWPAGASSGVVVVDQLSHLVPDDPVVFAQRFPGFPPPPAADNRTRLLEWQTSVLQLIARKLKVLLVLAHQLNENAKEHEEPDERSLRDSRGVGHKLDALVIPWRPSRLPNPDPGPGGPDTVPNVGERMWLTVPIARHGRGRFRVEVRWDGRHQRVVDMTSDEEAKWVRPAALDESRMAGMAALAEVQAKWARYQESVHDAANGAGEATTPPASLPARLAGLEEKWASPRPPAARVRDTRPYSNDILRPPVFW